MAANLFHGIPSSLPTELVETLISSKDVRIERIVSHGHASPEGFWYDQPQNEWVVLLQGAAKLKFVDQDRLLELGPGDFVNIPAHRKHRVEWTTPEASSVWLTVHYG